MQNSNDYDIWLSILDTLYICNKITYEDMHFIKGYFTACLKPNKFGVTPMELLYERMKGIKEHDSKKC